MSIKEPMPVYSLKRHGLKILLHGQKLLLMKNRKKFKDNFKSSS